MGLSIINLHTKKTALETLKINKSSEVLRGTVVEVFPDAIAAHYQESWMDEVTTFEEIQRWKEASPRLKKQLGDMDSA